MGLTERHWFENEDVPENYEWDLEDAVYNSRTNKKHDDLLPQEPRVMQLTEAMDAEVAWLEKYGENEIKPIIIISYEYGYLECLIYDEDDAEISLTIDGFNTDWRCWTSRPTDKQREAAPWAE